jgi:hypothetical protein
MLVYDNGRVCVLANTRCGHTSMYSYFGLEPYTVTNSIDHWYNTSSLRVLVLRNPLDRWVSAVRHCASKPSHCSEREWLERHGAPFLRNLVWKYYTWSHIDFYKLSDYIPTSGATEATHSNYANTAQLRRDPELRSELAAYKLIKRYSSELSVAQWRNLTG